MGTLLAAIKSAFKGKIKAYERVYSIKHPFITNPYSVAVISDAHSDYRTISLIIDEIARDDSIKDIIINGDLFDSTTDKNNKFIIAKIKELALKKKIYIVIGNHDLVEFIKENGKRKEFPSTNTEILNELRSINNVFIPDTPTGDKPTFTSWSLGNGINLKTINLPASYYENGEKKEELKRLLQQQPEYEEEDKYEILAIHTPKNLIVKKPKTKLERDSGAHVGSATNNLTKLMITEDLKVKPNLIISGHMHGGLVPNIMRKCFKHFWGFVGPYATLLPKYCSGWYNCGIQVLISAGLIKVAKSSEAGAASKKSFINGIFQKIWPPEYERLCFGPGEESFNKTSSKKHTLIK